MAHAGPSFHSVLETGRYGMRSEVLTRQRSIQSTDQLGFSCANMERLFSKAKAIERHRGTVRLRVKSSVYYHLDAMRSESRWCLDSDAYCAEGFVICSTGKRKYFSESKSQVHTLKAHHTESCSELKKENLKAR